MSKPIGIRLEDKNRWERRVPLVPEDLAKLAREKALSFIVQPSALRTFSDEDYVAAGAHLSDDLGEAGVILAVKEVPIEKLLEDRAYLFFSHVIKGQDYNMPLLQALLDKNITMIDYERILDDADRRLVFFGRQAGQAGMIETFHALGRRLESEGFETPLAEVEPAYHYEDLADAKSKIAALADAVAGGINEGLAPLVIGFAGYGNVSQGAQEIFDLLPHEEIAPGDLEAFMAKADAPSDRFYKVVFKEEHLVEPAEGQAFELQDYYKNPARYRGIFNRYQPHMTAFVNCIYWTEDYPRLITKADALRLQKSGTSRLRVVGDVSCDIDGSVEFTYKATEPDEPSFVYDAVQDSFVDGVEGDGIAVMSVDNLPCELPRDASAAFSTALKGYISQLADTDFSRPLDELGLPPELAGAIITHKGELAPDYRYLEEFLKKA